MKLIQLLLKEFAAHDGGNLPPPRRPSGPKKDRWENEDDMGSWKAVSFRGDTVYYDISSYCLTSPGKGLQIKVARHPQAVNAESEFLKNDRVDAYKKSHAELEPECIKMIYRFLAGGGAEQLERREVSWEMHQDEYNDSRDKKLSKRPVGKKSLPPGHKIVDGPKKGFRFVQLPSGHLVPNQGVNDHASDQDLIDNFYAWKALNDE